MAEPKLMKCGHTATGTYTDKNGNEQPCCVSCSGIVAGANEVAEQEPDLTGRIAKCNYGCGSQSASSLRLPFFEHKPNLETDRYYCGCYGWD